MSLFLFCSLFMMYPSLTSASIPTSAVTFDTNIEAINLTSVQEARLRKAEEVLRRVVTSEAFRKAVLNHIYEGKKTFVDNNGLTNLEIYNKIMEGAELLLPARNNRMDIGVKSYYSDDTTIGYTTRAITYINVNSKYFDTLSINRIAENIMHEWLHKIGFEHSKLNVPGRNYSVPYAVGAIVAALGEKN